MSNFAVPQATPHASSSSVADAVAAIPSFTATPLLRPLTTYTYTEDGVVETYVYIRHKDPIPENAYWGVFALMGLATVINIGFIAWATYRRYQVRWKKDIPASPRPSGRLSIRRLPHAILSASRIWGFRLRIPYVEMTLVEFALSMMYLTGCLAFTYAPTDSEKPAVHLLPNYWGAKAGLLGAAQMPLAVFLALKNNPVTWLTGLGHEKLILMHRVVSRCIFVLTWLHFVGEYYRSPELLMDEGWKVAGMVGAVAQTVTTIFGIKQIRHAYYEIFYSSHVVLILTFIITMHIHCIPMECAYYIWPCYVIWGFDRLLRGSRYVLFNLILRPKNRKALIEDIGSDGLRVTLKRRIPGGWKAGQHVFLAFPGLGIESHPFTIGNIYEKEEGGDEAEMLFIIRAMGGQTRMLMNRAMPTGTCELNALFDGPYGHPEDIRAFTTCIFIAGGTGVTYTVARMHQLFKDIHASNARATRVVFVWAVRTEVEYNWVAADIAKVVALVPSSVSLLVDIYLTGGARKDPALAALPQLEKAFDVEKDTIRTASASATPTRTRSNTSSDENEKADASGASTPTKPAPAYFASGANTPTTAVDGVFAFHRPGIARKDGRPDMRRILEEEITVSEGAVAVDVSGPDGLVNSVRSALSQPFTGPLATMRGTPTVLLSAEQFRM